MYIVLLSNVNLKLPVPFQKEIQALKLKQHEHVEFSSSFATEESNHPAILRLSSDGKFVL